MSSHAFGEELDDYFLTECDSSKSINIYNYSHFVLKEYHSKKSEFLIYLLSHLGCFECGIKYNGAKVQPPIDPFDGGPDDCQDLCEETEGCNYFTWRSYKTTPRRACILMQTKVNQIAKPTGISGSAYRCTAPGRF